MWNHKRSFSPAVPGVPSRGYLRRGAGAGAACPRGEGGRRATSSGMGSHPCILLHRSVTQAGEHHHHHRVLQALDRTDGRTD